MLFVSIAFASSNNLLLHGFRNRELRGLGDILFFNSLVSCIWIVILGALHGFAGISIGALIWGLCYGGVIAVFLLCKMQAMATGPVSITSFVGCSSLLIATAAGIVIFGETVTPIQIVGVILLIAALFLTVSPKAEKSKPGWKIWCAFFFLCSGATGIIFKLHQASDSASEAGGMMLTAAMTSAILFAAASVIVSKKQEHSMPRIPGGAIPYLIACGIVSCGYNRLNITLSGRLPSIVFFPVFNGSVILIATLSAVFIFREKLKKPQLAGLILGTAALIMAAGVVDGLLALI